MDNNKQDFDPQYDLTLGMTDDEMTERFRAAVRMDIEKKRIMGLPVSKYDSEKKCTYLEYPDGRREYE